MRKKFKGFVKICNGKTEEEALQALMENGFIKWLMGKDKDVYK